MKKHTLRCESCNGHFNCEHERGYNRLFIDDHIEQVHKIHCDGCSYKIWLAHIKHPSRQPGVGIVQYKKAQKDYDELMELETLLNASVMQEGVW